MRALWLAIFVDTPGANCLVALWMFEVLTIVRVDRAIDTGIVIGHGDYCSFWAEYHLQ